MKLSILDQTPVAEGMSAGEALSNTVKLAQKAETWGYERFWISEHHDSQSLAGSSPEILLAHIGAVTRQLRLGTGGVMLPHYSPYKIAENFHMLEALYPNRIDAGMGRAPGGMPRATLALSEGKPRRAERFPQQVDDLFRYLRYENIPEYAYGEARAMPITENAPPLWILGSSGASAALAAEKGLSYNFAHFINPEGGTQFVEDYYSNFQPSPQQTQPLSIVTVFVICADTQKHAEYIAASLDLSMLSLAKGLTLTGTPDPKTAGSYVFTDFEKDRIRENRDKMIIGDPAKVKEELQRFAAEYQAEEIMICTIAFHHEDRMRSYELIHNLFEK